MKTMWGVLLDYFVFVLCVTVTIKLAVDLGWYP